MHFVSFCSRFIDRFAPCVLFCGAMSAHQFTVMLTCTYANVTVAKDVLVVVYNKNVGESGYAISSWSASAGYSASMLTEYTKVDSSSTRQLLPSSVNISADIQHYLVMTR